MHMRNGVVLLMNIYLMKNSSIFSGRQKNDLVESLWFCELHMIKETAEDGVENGRNRRKKNEQEGPMGVRRYF